MFIIIKFTRWIDETKKSIEEIEDLLLQERTDNDQIGQMSGYRNWNIEKLLHSNKVVPINGNNIEYNVFSFSTEKYSLGVDGDVEEVLSNSGKLIVFVTPSNKVNFIIDKNSGAMQLIRRMLFYNGKNEIRQYKTHFNGDRFVWLISRIYNGENIFEGGNEYLENLTIDAVRGIKGDTEDSLTTVSAVGESVMNIISTLSFLIESKNLKQINIDLKYKKYANISIRLNSSYSVDFNEDRYIGEPLQNQTLIVPYAELVLMLYMEIIPIIIQNYHNDVEADLWGNNKCVEFLQRVADDLSDKVKERITSLKEKPEQLTLPLFNLPL